MVGYFRDQLIAASLKRDRRWRNQHHSVHFRDQLIAASLKHHREHRENLKLPHISAIN